MKKLLIIILILSIVCTPISAKEGIFDLDKKDSILLGISSLALFVGVKNNLVLSAGDEHPARVVLTALSYQAFVTLFAIVIDNNK
jgi:hypothetical protein